jgi:hypothetical protein
MDLDKESQRSIALQMMLKTYKPSFPVKFVSDELAFASESDCVAFLEGKSVTLQDNTKIITAKG